MIKGIADPLGAFYRQLLEARENKGKRPALWTTGQFLIASQILNVVDHVGPIRSAADSFLKELRGFTGGSSISANAFRSDQEDFAAFALVEGALDHLKDTLRSARMSTQAKHLCIPCDETEVADPF